MVKFKFTGFDQDIAATAVALSSGESKLYICPTHCTVTALQKAYQGFTDFSQTSFVTMDEFKLEMLQCDMPLLKEEKRTLALYAALKETGLQNEFHIANYFQSLPFARNFFNLFTELAEEKISFNSVHNVLAERETLNQWQSQHFASLLELRAQYKNYIDSHGYSDIIFLYQVNAINHEYTSRYNEIIVVNHYHFTAMEKALLPEDKTLLLLQIPESLYDKDRLQIKPDFSAVHITEHLTQKIDCHVFNDQFSLKYHLFNQPLCAQDTIIDTGIIADHLKCHGSFDCADTNLNNSFTSSSIYRFISTLHLLTSSIIKAKDRLLIPVNSLITAISNQQFISYFISEEQLAASNEQKIWEDLLEWLYTIIDHNNKYLDLKLNLLPQGIVLPPQVKDTLRQLCSILEQFYNINSFSQFKTLINNRDCINLSRILTVRECSCSNIPEIYYRLLQDFWALDEINIIDNWQDILSNMSITGFETGSAFLKLLADYSKAKEFNWIYTDQEQDLPQLTNLHNSYNLSYNHVIIADAVEGKLPSPRKMPFLLTEHQRSALGLRCYKDTLAREKYYFLRLVAQSKRVTILTREQELDSTEISSFVEELQMRFTSIFSINAQVINYEPAVHLGNWLKPAFETTSAPQLPADFFTLKFEPDHDLKNGSLYLTPSSILTFIEQPFNYYLDRLAKLRERKTFISMEYSGRQLGDIIHAVFALVWERLNELYPDKKVVYDFNLNKDNYASRALENYLMQFPALLLQKPHNFSELYFDSFIKNFIIEAVTYFLHFCADKFSMQPVNIISEHTISAKDPFISTELYSCPKFKVMLTGRADLIIKDIKPNINYIFDYKTGKESSATKAAYVAQLCFYQKLYFSQSDDIKKFIFFITDTTIKEFDKKNDALSDLITRLNEQLAEIDIKGYEIGSKPGSYENDALTRRSIKPPLTNQ